MRTSLKRGTAVLILAAGLLAAGATAASADALVTTSSCPRGHGTEVNADGHHVDACVY